MAELLDRKVKFNPLGLAHGHHARDEMCTS